MTLGDAPWSPLVDNDRVPVRAAEQADGPAPGGAGWERERGPSLVRALWRYRWAILAVVLLCTAAGYVYGRSQPTVFQAASSIKLLNPYDRTLFRQERGVPFTDVDRYLNAQADLVKSPEVMARASELLENQLLPGQIRQHVSAEGSTQIFEVTIRASFEDPQQAADVANAVTQAYQDVAAAESRRMSKRRWRSSQIFKPASRSAWRGRRERDGAKQSDCAGDRSPSEGRADPG